MTLEDDLYAALTRATQVMAQAEKKLKSLAAENAKLRRQVGIKERMEEVREELASVQSEIRRHQSGGSVDHYGLSVLLDKRRFLTDRLDRLDRRQR